MGKESAMATHPCPSLFILDIDGAAVGATEVSCDETSSNGLKIENKIAASITYDVRFGALVSISFDEQAPYLAAHRKKALSK